MDSRSWMPLLPALLASCASAPGLPAGFELHFVPITVVDALQQPVASAEVRGPAGAARTDARGVARLPWASGRAFGDDLRVVAPGFVVAIETWHGAGQQVELQRDEPIRVRVLEHGTDRPLPDVAVWRAGRPELRALTDGNGETEVRGVEPLAGDVPALELRPWDRETLASPWITFLRHDLPEVAIERDGSTFVVRLRASPLADVVLQGVPGRPLTTPVFADGMVVPRAQVEAGGARVRCRLRAGEDVPIRVAGYEEQEFTFRAGDAPDVVDLVPAVECVGRVVGPHRPIAGARVWLRWQDQFRPGVEVVTRADGSWSAAGCSQRWPIRFWVEASGFVFHGGELAVSGSAPPTSGVVTIGDLELEREQLVVARLDPSWRGRSRLLYTSGPDGVFTSYVWSWPDGKVVLRGLGAGRHQLWADDENDGTAAPHLLFGFVLDGSDRVLDLGPIPGAAPPPPPEGARIG